jgi:hypothetical protein
MRPNLRNANISAAVGAVVLFVGVYLFRHAGEGVLQLILVVSWIVMFGTLAVLNARDDRQRRRNQ